MWLGAPQLKIMITDFAPHVFDARGVGFFGCALAWTTLSQN
jgi:hypothetical protein